METLSVTYQKNTRDGLRAIPATLRKASRPGTWSIWADDPADAPFTWAGSHRVTRALLSNLGAHEVAYRYPEHAGIILSQPDTSD